MAFFDGCVIAMALGFGLCLNVVFFVKIGKNCADDLQFASKFDVMQISDANLCI